MNTLLAATSGATLVGCLFIVIATGAAVYFFMKKNCAEERANSAEERATSFQQMQTIIFEEIKNVRELVTIRKNFTSMISFSDDKKIPLLNVHMPGSDRKFLMNYAGTITCGCDLDKIRIKREETTGNRVKIVVPHSQILDIYANVNSFQIHHQETGILADNFVIQDQHELIKADLEKEHKRALNEGLLERADENIRQMLMSIVERRGLNSGFEVEVVFTDSDAPALLDSPQNLLR